MYKKRFKNRKTNPLYHHYSLLSNTFFCLHKIKLYCPVVFIVFFFQIVSESVLQYFWGIAGKYIIEIIQLPGNFLEKQPVFIKTICVILILGLILSVIQQKSQSGSWWRLVKIRMNVITERIEKVLSISYEYLESPEVLDIHQRAQQATSGNEMGFEGMLHKMERIGVQLCTLIVTFFAITTLDWRLLLILIANALINFFLYKYVIKVDKKNVWDELSPYWRRIFYLNRTSQDFNFAKDIRLFNLKPFLMNKLRKTYDFKEGRMSFHENCWTAYNFATRLPYMIAQFFIYGVLVYAVTGKNMSIANFSMYLGFAMSFSGSLTRILQLLGDYIHESLRVDDLRSFMEIKDKNYQEIEKQSVPVCDEYEIVFHNVTYQYADTEKPALKNLNLTIHKGEKLAVVGLNGAGKTTMIKLLLRLYDPTEGKITLNGIDLRSFDRREYYKLFAPVFQDLEVFAFPIFQNVSMKEICDTDKSFAEKCLIEAGLEDKIKELPKGIDTELLKIVDKDGIDLSGGQKQKLALARALYKDAPIIILDEPTSALDALAEKQLYEKFDSMIGKKSAVYISHRLASTRFCDKIAMFMHGEMVEYGTHEELIAKKGEYSKMFEIQAQYYQEENKAGGNDGEE